MKTRCKNVKLDYEFISYWTYDFLKGDYKRSRPAKWKRRDFQRMISQINSVPLKEVRLNVKYHNLPILQEYSDTIALKLYNDISTFLKSGELNIPPIEHFQKFDGLSGKERRCCVMQPYHQLLEYIGLRALNDLFVAKIETYQCASVLNRGQLYGKKAIERWVRKEKLQYYVQCDIVKCFKNLSCDKIIKLLERDISKNKDLIKYISKLLSVYENGMLEIGTILSASLCNYVLSYAYRYSKSITFKRRNKAIPCIKHTLTFMDDFLFVGSNKKELLRAVNETELYLKDFLNLSFHVYKVKNVHEEPIDMMGYVIAYKKTTIRYRIYKRAIRVYIRALNWLKHHVYLCRQIAYRICAYYGYFKHTNSIRISTQLRIPITTLLAKETVAYYSAKETLC